MLHALKEIGEYALKEELNINNDSEISNTDVQIKIISEDKNNHNHVLFICLDENYNYQNITLEEFKKENFYLYMNKNVKGKVKPYAPIYSIDNPEDALNKVIEFSRIENLNEIYNILSNKNKEIISAISENMPNLKKDQKIFLTLKINGKYLFEIYNFKEIFLKRAWNSILKESKKENSICSVCFQEKEIFTSSEIYKFYTNDKEVYIAGGLKKENAHKNFPICKECFFKVSYGRKYIEKFSTFSFYGKNKNNYNYNYNLIPKSIGANREVLEQVINIIKDRNLENIDINSLSRITSDEKEILFLLKDFNDNVFVNLFLLEKSNTNNAEKIILLIEDVLPSRLKKIFEIKSTIDNIFYENSQEKYTLGKIFYLLKNGKIYDFYEYFLEITDSIFTGKKLDYIKLINVFNKSIRKKFIENSDFISKDPIINLIFLEKLKLIEYKGGIRMRESFFDDFYSKNHLANGLNTDFKRGLFLLGSLVKHVMVLQYRKIGSTPFYKNLKGLNLNTKDVLGLVPKCHNKLIELSEYKILSKKWDNLMKEMNNYFLEESNPKISLEELNFYISAGMSFYNDVKTFLEDKFSNDCDDNNKEEN